MSFRWTLLPLSRIFRSVFLMWNFRSWDSLVTRLRTARSGVRIPERLRELSLWGPTHTLLFHGYWCSFPGLKRPEHDIDHSHRSSAKVKNVWNCTSSPPVLLHNPDRAELTFLCVLSWNVRNLLAWGYAAIFHLNSKSVWKKKAWFQA